MIREGLHTCMHILDLLININCGYIIEIVLFNEYAHQCF